MKTRKKILIVLIIAFLCTVAIQPFIYNNFKNTNTVSIICKTSYLDIYDYPTSFPQNIEVSTPIHPQFKLYPAVIMLHGDDMGMYSLNLLKLEFLRNGYMVITMDIPVYYSGVFFILNATVNYLLSRTDVNASQIGILGHSHGANYAILFSSFRNDSVHAVVAADFGPIQSILNDYYPFYKNDVVKNNLLPDTYSDFVEENKSLSLPMNLTTPNNLLLIDDKFDNKIQGNPDLYLQYYTNSNLNQIDKIYGNFNEGTARELLIESSLFGHLSGILSPTGINAAISWMNRALHVPNMNNNYPYAVFLTTSIILPFTLLLGIIVVVLEIEIKFKIIPRLKKRHRTSKNLSESKSK